MSKKTLSIIERGFVATVLVKCGAADTITTISYWGSIDLVHRWLAVFLIVMGVSAVCIGVWYAAKLLADIMPPED